MKRDKTHRHQESQRSFDSTVLPAPEDKLNAMIQEQVDEISDLATETVVNELHESLGLASPELATTLLAQTARANEIEGPKDVLACKSVAAAFRGIGPTDELEALLAAQMVATHTLAMRFLGKTSPTKYPDKVIDSNLNRGTKLMRMFLMQVDALNRNRSKGRQRMVVEHVHVYRGGQAIVGQVGNDGDGSSHDE